MQRKEKVLAETVFEVPAEEAVQFILRNQLKTINLTKKRSNHRNLLLVS